MQSAPIGVITVLCNATDRLTLGTQKNRIIDQIPLLKCFARSKNPNAVPDAAEIAALNTWEEIMACQPCSFENQSTFNGEVAIHFPARTCKTLGIRPSMMSRGILQLRY